MAKFKLTIQSFLNGKPCGISGTTVEAGTAAEAKQKYLANHPPSTTRKVKVIACVKL